MYKLLLLGIKSLDFGFGNVVILQRQTNKKF
nr:MAG TPA: Sterol regulatory element-binding protein cleavage-activating sheet, WD40, STRUCTURAL PROTEIN [Caudoviricetes sp.]DAN67208.1 MAG TPA: Sterol regulatory element-binding protein cleavage-activating sheet, WD40, STRUCTURAL PROTEIN [Bacteriophage sp.]